MDETTLIVFFDTETFPIRPGRQAPRVVCVQTSPDHLELREEGLDRIEEALDAGATLVAHNAAFDVLCTSATRPRLLEKWVKAYEEDRVECTMVREQLIRIQEGKLKSSSLSLAGCLKAHNIPDPFAEGAKQSAVRTSYGQLDNIPVDRWPAEARDYALADLVVADLYHAQEAGQWTLEDQHRQARAAFALAYTSAWGMRTDPAAIRDLSDRIEDEHDEIRSRLMRAGLVRATGSKNTKAAKALMVAACQEKGVEVPKTDTGAVGLSADDCLASGDSRLVAYARYGSIDKLRARVNRLTAAGDLPIQPRFNVLVETGRTSCRTGNVKPGRIPLAFGDQVQNPHREPGVRECYRARDGYLLCAVDWSSAELHSLAQVCTYMGIGSELGRVLNAGLDAHLNFACLMKGWNYGWAKESKSTPEVKEARQAAKAANFGFPGGLGAEKFRWYAAKTYGVDLTMDQAWELKEWWFQAYPEMTAYFQRVQQVHEDGKLVQFKSGRVRGGATYCATANSYFQGLTADMAKDAGFRLAKETITGRLKGARLWNFVHDEWILEVPEDRASEYAAVQVEVMEEAGRAWCPDVPVKVEPALMRVWSKAAEPVYDEEGRLQCWNG